MQLNRKIRNGALASSLAMALMTSATPAAGPASCDAVYAVGETYATSEYTFEGSAFTNLGNYSVSVALLGSKDTGNGLLVTTTHTFHGPDGSFSTMDNARLSELSPGLYLLSTQASIVDGGWGNMNIDGLIDFSTGTARWFAKGQLCRR
jgi:hypothetical protein